MTIVPCRRCRAGVQRADRPVRSRTIGVRGGAPASRVGNRTMRGIQRQSLAAVLCLVLGCAAAAPAAPAAGSSATGQGMLGFTASGAARQRALEQRYDALLDASEMRAWLKRMSSEPNQVGSPHDKANAEFMLSLFRAWGWDAHIETFDVLYPTPTQELVEMVAPTTFKASLHEPPIKGDATSSLPGALPPYNVYGGGWRGLKPELAYQHGAVGCLIYSDPRDDGYFQGDPYPEGGWRPPEGVQRGSVAKMQIYPGDPTTPGYGSVPGAKHIPIGDAKTVLKIPVLPISYADATPLLKAMGGPVAPESWRGALPFTYH